MKYKCVPFIKEVKKEVQKVSWPSKKEAIALTITVLVVTLISSIFLLLADTAIYNLVQFLLKIGSKS